MTQSEIMSLASCWTCLGLSLPEAVKMVLLNEVSENISGGGGGSSNLTGVGSPVGVVTPDAVGQFYTETGGPILWQATGVTAADWQQLT